ncbi:short-chain dehydrogenase [Thermosipho sp. 1063]|uniref:SDR family NAD(P)-dependent oxidoreductase n=1 Tax=unclassified Thermosipho (in: thermotogales) TaxID=2676525 RepID=UPI00094947C8|nr:MULTISPECIES: SDR family NAD(P)-dependent oxidoreductase [unclassified Thermosipho (in: thermotogales)]ANQ54521.1 short-chain dehydrogenase [Thermosipho sp. 1070]APT72963.1 short-chain dehydrogenase [Thermosipho sp. 1063]OOC42418.1 short-chain dehydrogenase [Thermosipho sp. 1074]
MPKFQSGEWVLITGGSSGIGEEFAYQLAKKGVNLILIGRNSERLKKVSEKTRKINKKIDLLTFSFDLSRGLHKLIEKLEKFNVTHLINNAGFGWYGNFTNANQEIYEKMILVNISALTYLSYYYAKKFSKRKNGGIINVASVAAFFPIPHFTVYGATKAYVYNFSLSLWAEMRKNNVHVMCLAPGKTKTRFFERANMKNQKKLMSTKFVVEGAIDAYEKNKPLYIPGTSNKFLYSFVRRIISDKFLAKILEKHF